MCATAATWCNGVTTILSVFPRGNSSRYCTYTGANRFYIKFLLTREYTRFLPEKYVSNRMPTGWTLVNRSATIRDGRLVSLSRWRTTEFPDGVDWAKINPLPLRHRRTPPPRVSTSHGVLRAMCVFTADLKTSLKKKKAVSIWSGVAATSFDLWSTSEF